MRRQIKSYDQKPINRPAINPLAAALSVTLLAALLGLVLFGGTGITTAAPQATDPAPTLVPPTPLPQQITPTAINQPEFSALASVQTDRVLRVGTYYNAYPFAWLNENGSVVGYEVDILRSIGVEFGVDVEFIQVTRHNDLDMLLSGEVDLLIGQQVITWDRAEIVDFTHPYYLNAEQMVIREGSSYGELRQLAGLPVSVEIGSRSERALRHWMAQTGVQLDVYTFFTESDALDALANNVVEGMAGELDNLRRAGRLNMSLVPEPVLLEPYAIVVRRGDVNLRNLLNRTLQRLKASGRLNEIHGEWFPGETMNFDTLVPVYEDLYGDERGLDQFPYDMPVPSTSMVQRIQSGQSLRVAGIMLEGEEAPAHIRLTNALNKAMIEDMAREWGVEVYYVPGSALNAVDFVANGQADIAVGANPRWDGADRVEYSLPYVLHGDRMLVKVNAQIEGFWDMLGTGWWIGYFADDSTDAELIAYYADFFGVGQNIREPFAIYHEDQAIYTMVVEDNLDAIFGDNLRLEALVRDYENANAVKMLEDWYGALKPITLAVPRNDAAFRNLVDQTLQHLAQTGAYQDYWQTLFGLGDPITIPAWGAISPDAPAPPAEEATS